MIATLLTSLAALGVLGVLAEIGTRLWLSKRNAHYVWPPHKHVRLEIDSEALPQLPSPVNLHFNAQGERGGPLPKDWKRNHRTLVAGGSAAECYFLDQDKSWHSVIEQQLSQRDALQTLSQASGASLEGAYVGNISRSLVSCEYITKILQRTLHNYERLDAIVLMVGASDVVFWLEQKTPEQLEEDRLGLGKIFAELPTGPFSWSVSGLALRRLAAHTVARFSQRAEERTRAGKRLISLREMRNRAQIEDTVPDPQPLLNYFEKHFKQLLEVCAKKAKRVVVARQPWFDRDFTEEEQLRLWNFGQGRPYQGEVKTYYSHRVVRELMRSIDTSAARIADEVGVESLNLLPHLELSFDTFYDFLHLTPKGAQVVGEAIAEHLLASGSSVESDSSDLQSGSSIKGPSVSGNSTKNCAPAPG